MKIAVFSDSHGRTEGLIKAIYDYSPDMIVHLGDYVKDADILKSQFPQTPLRAVRGNCDFMSSKPDVVTFSVGELKVLITHGHKLAVKSGIALLIEAAHTEKADLVIFGHTHIAFYDVVSGMHVLNPGTAGGARQAPTYAQLEIDSGIITCVLCAL